MRHAARCNPRVTIRRPLICGPDHDASTLLFLPVPGTSKCRITRPRTKGYDVSHVTTGGGAVVFQNVNFGWIIVVTTIICALMLFFAFDLPKVFIPENE